MILVTFLNHSYHVNISKLTYSVSLSVILFHYPQRLKEVIQYSLLLVQLNFKMKFIILKFPALRIKKIQYSNDNSTCTWFLEFPTLMMLTRAQQKF